MLIAMPDDGSEINNGFVDGRDGLLQAAGGQITIDGGTLLEADRAEISSVATIIIIAKADSEIISFDRG